MAEKYFTKEQLVDYAIRCINHHAARKEAGNTGLCHDCGFPINHEIHKKPKLPKPVKVDIKKPSSDVIDKEIHRRGKKGWFSNGSGDDWESGVRWAINWVHKHN